MSRLISISFLLVTGFVLALSLYLEPSAEGHGTHTQLGLNSCTFLAWTEFPCPMCGMTTTFALMAHGRVFQAIANQPMGVVLFLVTLCTFFVSLKEVIRPRCIWKRAWSVALHFEARVVISVLLALVAAWVYKIWMMKG